MSELLEAMLEGLYLNPLDPRERVLLDGEGNPLAGVTLHHMNPGAWGHNYLHMEEIRGFVKGGARKLMEILIERADQYGATLAGHVKPLPAQAYGLKKMPKRKLIAWYKKFGFEREKFGSRPTDDMIRRPRTAG